jgi:3',5'-cyclic AMP phosphodiesterase CpdA
LKWLNQELDSDKRIILFIHHPIIAINAPIDKVYPLKNREVLRRILEDSNKNITIFCGHYHMNDEQNYKNIYQFATQALSFQVVKNAEEIIIDNSTFGYRIIDISESKIDTQIVTFKP